MNQTYFIDPEYIKDVLKAQSNRKLKLNHNILSQQGIMAGIDDNTHQHYMTRYLTALYTVADGCKDKTKVNLPEYYGMLSVLANRLVHFYDVEQLFEVSNRFLDFMDRQLEIVKHYPEFHKGGIDWEAQLYRAFLDNELKQLLTESETSEKE